MKRSVVRLSVRPIIRPPHAAAAGLLLLARRVIAKFHYTDTDTDPTRTGPDQTKSAHIVGYELNSTTRTRQCARTLSGRVRSVSGPCPCPCSGI